MKIHRGETPRKTAAPPLGLNAVGKPYSASYDPNYRLKYVTSTGHLRLPYLRIKFVGEEVREAPNGRQQPNRRQQPKLKESAARSLTCKSNPRKVEVTASRFIGSNYSGSYILSPVLHCWSVDY